MCSPPWLRAKVTADILASSPSHSQPGSQLRACHSPPAGLQCLVLASWCQSYLVDVVAPVLPEPSLSWDHMRFGAILGLCFLGQDKLKE